MSRRMWPAIGLWTALCIVVPAATAVEQQTRFVITGPTLISFCLDYSDKQVEDGEGGINEVLSDFVFYLSYAEDKLRDAGVQVHAVFKVKSFQVKRGSRWRIVKPQGVTVGYYFIAPGREPRIEFGVQDTEGILDMAREYFQLKSLPK